MSDNKEKDSQNNTPAVVSAVKGLLTHYYSKRFEFKKASDMNIENPLELISATLLSPQRKLEISSLAHSYKKIATNLDSLMQVHFKYQSESYAHKAVVDGGVMSYLNTPLYIFYSGNSGNHTYVCSGSHDSPMKNYLFNMYHLASNLEYLFHPSHHFTYQGPGKAQHDIVEKDIYRSFDYAFNGTNIDHFLYDEETEKREMNKVAYTTFKENQEEFYKINKKVFKKYAYECIDLRDASDDMVIDVCTMENPLISPDYFIEYELCLKIFQFARIEGVCPIDDL